MDPLTHALASYNPEARCVSPRPSFHHHRHTCRGHHRRNRLAEQICRPLCLPRVLSHLFSFPACGHSAQSRRHLPPLPPQTRANGESTLAARHIRRRSSRLHPPFAHGSLPKRRSRVLLGLFRRAASLSDWLPHLDLWILGILLAGILFPTLSRLVTEEIGAKSKGPRGKVGASLALAAMILYVVLRFVLHGNALAALESRSYRGESPRKTAAFPESGSPFRWLGIVETVSALHEVEVDVSPGASFNPDAALTSYKPEPSPALDAARDTAVARRFFQAARFPKATVEKTPGGFHINPACLSFFSRCRLRLAGPCPNRYRSFRQNPLPRARLGPPSLSNSGSNSLPRTTSRPSFRA